MRTAIIPAPSLSTPARGVTVAQTILERLRTHAEERPDTRAFVHLQDGQVAGALSYGALRSRAGSIGAGLQSIGVRHGERVVLLFPSSLDFIASFLACQWIGAIPVPAYPPQRDALTARRIITHCEASWVLASTAVHHRIVSKFGGLSLSPDRLVAVDTDFGADVGELVATPHEIALLQYTSGSTSAPKGVVLTHANLLANVAAITSHMGTTSGETAVSWLPMYHDMGLIGMVLGSLYSGVTLNFMAPTEFVRNPARWLQAIVETKARYSGGPNFAYQHCVDRIGPAVIADLDLSGWRVATNGAEPVRSGVLEAFCEKFAECGFSRKAFLPCYGLAESALMVTGVSVQDQAAVRYVDKTGLKHGRVVFRTRSAAGIQPFVSCGSVISGHDLVIADPATEERLPENRCGEIWVSGPSVTPGYWAANAADAPDQPQPFAMLNNHDGEPKRYLRTGDLGFVSDGQLFVTGRIKDLIIVRGLNYHPQDLEEAAWRSHPAIEPSGVIAFQAEPSNPLDIILIAEIRRELLSKIDSADIVAAMRSALSSEFQLAGIAVGLVRPRALPRTSSGKVQRSRARDMHADGEFDCLTFDDRLALPGTTTELLAADADAAIHPRSETEAWLLELVARNLKIDRDLVRCDTPIIDMGIDSLSQLQLTHEISAKFGVEIEVEHYFDGVSIRGVGQLIENA